MTEDEWFACTSPEAMLNHLGEGSSPRKLRLYAVNCCRRIWGVLTDERCRHAVEIARAFSDDRATPAELASAGHLAAPVARVWGDAGSRTARSTYAVGGSAWATTRPFAWDAAWDSAYDARLVARDRVLGSTWEGERFWQAALLHDLFGNPFRGFSPDPCWLLANDGAASHLARLIYDEDRFGDLPYLADALEDAGCCCESVLTHCRAKGNHYRGCWVVDAVLGFA